jgi:hypothetical protein
MSWTNDESTSDRVAPLLMRTITQHHPQTPRLQPQALGKGADDRASLSEQNQQARLWARQSGRTPGRGHHPFDPLDYPAAATSAARFQRPDPALNDCGQTADHRRPRHPGGPGDLHLLQRCLTSVATHARAESSAVPGTRKNVSQCIDMRASESGTSPEHFDSDPKIADLVCVFKRGRPATGALRSFNFARW